MTGIAPHPLGGFRATSVDDRIASPEDLGAKLAEHEARAKAELVRVNAAFDRDHQERHARYVAEAAAKEAARKAAEEAARAEAMAVLRDAFAKARTPREAWAEAIRDRIDPEVATEVIERAGPAVRLVRVADGARSTASFGWPPASKLGGYPDLPVGTPWPTGERPLAFLAQIALDTIAPPLRERLGLPEGMLSFFFDLANEPWEGRPGDGALRVLWTPPGAQLEPRRPDDEDDSPPMIEAAIELVEDFQVPWEPELTELIEANAERHGPSSGHVGGHPVPIQVDDDPPVGAVLLLQLASDERHIHGDGGRFYVWIEPDDLRARRFDRAWHRIESY